MLVLLVGPELDGVVIKDEISHDIELRLKSQLLEIGPACSLRLVRD